MHKTIFYYNYLILPLASILPIAISDLGLDEMVLQQLEVQSVTLETCLVTVKFIVSISVPELPFWVVYPKTVKFGGIADPLATV